MLPATLPTGDDVGLGMGHVMLMPGLFVRVHDARAALMLQAGYGRALSESGHAAGSGHGVHAHGTLGSLVDPMSDSELEVSLTLSVRASARYALLATLAAATPIATEGGRARGAIGGVERDTGASRPAPSPRRRLAGGASGPARYRSPLRRLWRPRMRTPSPTASVLVAVVVACWGCDSDGAGNDVPESQPDGGQDAAAASDGAGGAGGSAADAGPPPPSLDAGPERAITIRFRAQVGDQLFSCGESYPAQGTTAVEITPRAFKFYVHDLRLITVAGDEVPVAVEGRGQWQLPEVSLLDFSDVGDCNPAIAVNAVITGRVPVGDYRGVAFANGVPPALNHADPVTLTGPLQAPGMHWTWMSGFRFLIAEVAQQVGPDGQDDAGSPGGAGILHLGSVACSGSFVVGDIRCQRPNRNQVRLDDFDEERDVIVADLGALFREADLSAPSVCHSFDTLCEPMIEALGIDWLTGTPMSEQRVYRVEPRGEDPR